jgi:arylsulfatase A-like enzyme
LSSAAIARSALAIVAALWVAGACARRPEPPPHVRVLEKLGRARIVLPRIPRPELPLVRDKRIELGPARRKETSLARIRLGPRYDRDERVAMLAPPGGSVAVRVRVPEQGRLITAVATISGAGAPARLSLSLQPDASDGAATIRLGQWAPEPGSDPPWQEVRVDLSRWSGRDVELTFAGEGGAAAPWGAFAAPRLEGRRVRAGRFNVVLISIDTLRADRLGAWGYERRPTSPQLDAWAGRSIRFASAFSQAPWTRPSHLAMLSGLYPVPREGVDPQPISETLWRAGYRTLAITGGGQVDSRFGFDRGFELYRMADWIRVPESVFTSVEALGEAPFFLFLHTFETHEPYTDRRFADGMPAGRIDGAFTKEFLEHARPGLTREEKELASTLYDGDIAFTDERLGAFFAAARRAGWLEDTIFVLTSDHGEQLWEHGSWGHGQSLYDHQLHVPLIVHVPPALARSRGLKVEPGSVVGDQVQLVDLTPTILDLLGVEPAAPLDGRSLVPLLDGRGLPPGEVFAEGTNLREIERRGLRTPRFKFIHTIPRRARQRELEGFELFDLRADPGERTDLAARHPEMIAALVERVRLLSRGATTEFEGEVPAGIDADLVEDLRALGYLGN